jgi:hypothetical protein
MRKLFLIFFILIISCTNSAEETTTIQDITTTTSLVSTTTTTIPPVPTVDFNIVEIYNTKLGTELCSDATEIDATSETCLKQYRDNLETVFSYAENLQTYITELNTFFEAYPSEMTEAYTTFFQFVNDEYQAVPETYRIVGNKYIERFGGVPSISDILILNPDQLSSGCTIDWKVDAGENFKDGYVIYKNNTNEQFMINLTNKSGSLELVNSGGTFYPTEIVFRNYLNEVFNSEIFSSLYITHLFPRFTKFEFDKNIVGLNEELKLFIEWEDGVENIDIDSFSISISSIYGTYADGASLGISNQYPWEGMMYGGYVDYEKNEGYFRFLTVGTTENKPNSDDGSTRYINNRFDPVKSPFFVSWAAYYSGGIKIDSNEAYGDNGEYRVYRDYRSKCKPLVNKVNFPLDINKVQFSLDY